MKKKKAKSFFMNPWTIGIGTTSFGVLLTIIRDWITANKLFATLSHMFSTIRSAAAYFLNIELKVWWLLVGLIFLITIVYVWLRIVEKKHPFPKAPKYLEYTKDTLLGFDWEWEWREYSNKYCIVNLHPVCPECNTPIVSEHHGYGEWFICLRCGYHTTKSLPDTAHVEMLIKDNIRRKHNTEK